MRAAVVPAAALLLCTGAVLASGRAPAAEKAPVAHEYVGWKKCRTCHKKEEMGNQVAAWQKSKHAKAWETLGSDKARKWAAEKGIEDPQQADECLKCHTTAFGVPEEFVSRKFDPKDGVQCEGCHGAGKDFRKKKIMADRDLAVSKGLVLQSEEVCVECHNDESPAWDPERYERPDGTKVGFDYDMAVEEIAHPVPEGYDPFAEDPE